MAKVIFERKSTNEIKSNTIKDGKLLYNYETGETYMDVADYDIFREPKRIPINKLPKIVTTTSDTDTYSCNYINSEDDRILNNAITVAEDMINEKIKKDIIFDGIGEKPTGTGTNGSSQTTLSTNPLAYDIVYVTVSNNGNEQTTATIIVDETKNSTDVYFYVLKDYNASLRITLSTSSITLNVSEITGWPISNLYISKVVGVKF